MPRTIRPLASRLALEPSPRDLAQAFIRRAPLQIDLGCGDGAFLVELARRHPEQNFLGIERLLRRSSSACRRAERAEIENVRILRAEIEPTLKENLAPESVHCFHILFPDPWPKRRHHHRRLFQTGFLKTVHRGLVAGGEVRFRTDDATYFEHAGQVAIASPEFERLEWTIPPDYPRTAFERRFLSRDLPIFSLRLRKRPFPG